MILFWFILWPLLCIILMCYILHQILESNKQRSGWAYTPWNPTFNLVIDKGTPKVALQMEGHQYLFESSEELEKLLQDANTSNSRMKVMKVIMDEKELKSELDKNFESL